MVHPYTIRTDELPKHCPSSDAVHLALFQLSKVDGMFTDFSDVTLTWLRNARAG